MSGVATAVIGTQVVGSYLGTQSAEKAAKEQAGASKEAIAEERRQFNAIQELLRPYVEAGLPALGAQQALAGLAGPQAQQQAITAIEQGPLFRGLAEQGEEAILQRASATGGLRGGDVQTALAQYRPQLLNQLIESQYAKLAGLTGVGQASATGQAAAAQQTGANVSNLLTQIGQARAGAALAQGQAAQQIAGTVGALGTLKLLGGF